MIYDQVFHTKVGGNNENYPKSQNSIREKARNNGSVGSYAFMAIGSEPIIITPEDQAIWEQRTRAILKIFSKIAEAYKKNKRVRKWYDIASLQFEDNLLRSLIDPEDTNIENSRFGGDIIGNQLLEMNAACPGGILGISEILGYQQMAGDYAIALNNTYTDFCQRNNKQPIENRKIAYLTYYGFTVDGETAVDSLNKAGLDVISLPAEAIEFDTETNQAYYLENGKRVTVD